MHDIDRTLTELETESEFESEFEDENGELEFEDDDDFGEFEFDGFDDVEVGPVDSPARIFGMELEGLSPEDQEFEACKRFVRLTSDAVANSVAGSRSAAPPTQIVRNALVQAAKKHAPGLVRGEGEFEFEYDEFTPAESGRVFSEAEEMELAADLLSVSDDEELEQFLGGLIKKAAKGVGGLLKRGVGGKLFKSIKGIAKKALPIAGSAVGGIFGGPVGAMAGGSLGRALGAGLSRGRGRRRRRRRRRAVGRRRSGRWVRRGSSIVVIGV